MKRNVFAVVIKRSIGSLLLIVSISISVSAQAIDKNVETILKRYADIVEKARFCETDDDHGEYGDLVMNTLTVNSRHHQWRAVGIYGQTFKFFYTGGNTEEHLYPDQLVMVKTERHESDRTYSEEFLYSDTGVLMFYSQKAENDEETPADRRVYFSGIRPLRIVENTKTRDRFNVTDMETVKAIAETSRKIKELFVRSIKL